MTSFKIRLAVVLLATTSSVAQTMVGLEGGINWSSLETKPIAGSVYGTGSGRTYGILAESKMRYDFYLVVGVSYIKKTVPWLVHQYLKSTVPDIEYQFEYTQISASLKKEYPIQKFRFYFILGGTYGYLNSGSFINGRLGGPAHTSDITNNLNRSDFDLNGGLGLAYNPSKKLSIFADIKYLYDLLGISKNSASYAYFRSTQLSCGILFGV